MVLSRYQAIYYFINLEITIRATLACHRQLTRGAVAILSEAVAVILDREETIGTAPAVVARASLLPIYSNLIQDFIRRFYKEADKGISTAIWLGLNTHHLPLLYWC